MSTVTEQDIEMIHYFWQEKGDFERYARWIEILPELREKYPELIRAKADYEHSLHVLNLVVSSLQFKP